MSTPEFPPIDPRAGEIARAKLALHIALGAIAVSTVAAMYFLRTYPLPLRLFILFSDLVVMVTLWMVVRQKFSGK